MKNYLNQDGCWNCKHVFIRYDYEAPNECYCVYDVLSRPLCLSVGMNESPDNEDEWNEAYDKWKQWSKKHFVLDCGKCDNYRRE
jgi:hypothetical protein